jgi:YhcH/YjgK/YiaL family protein
VILDTLARSHHYQDIHPLFAQAFGILQRTDLAGLPAGRHEIDGDRLFLLIDHVTGVGRERTRIEHHRRYIDIQVCIEGLEEIGWMSIECCQKRDGEFDQAKDVGFFAEEPSTWLTLQPMHFAVFFPADAHAPLGGSGPVKKAILKVLV